MTLSMAERHLLAALGGLATVATSLSLFPALEEKRYFLIGAALSGLVVMIGIAARQLHVPAAVVALIQLVVLGDLLLMVYGGHTWQGFVPTSATFRTTQHVLSDGMDIANRYAAPVPHSPGLMLMCVGFIGFVAIVVDLLAGGLGRAPLVGLPLLALYAVPVAALPDGVPAWCFVPGAAAFLALLMVAEHERLTHWGRHVARTSVREHVDTIDTSAMSANGRRISLLAITTAVIVPLLIPGFSRTLFHGEGGIGNGEGTLSFSDPMVSLAEGLHRKAPVDLITVTSDTPPSYLRLTVLDKPGPNSWTNSGVDADSTLPTTALLWPAPEGLGDGVARTPASMDLTVTSDFPRDSVWLPVPYYLTALNLTMIDGGLPDDFAFVPRDETVTSRTSGALARFGRYSASYNVVHPTEAQLESAPKPPDGVVAAYAGVPAGVPTVVRQVAADVTANATNDYQRALALQSFFRDNQSFTYDLDAAYGYGYRAMTRFLLERTGYCQHFAATMAMMARTLGIPARVVVGFLDPSKSDGQGSYVFTSHDAHAWPELYFSGVGWVRFEPTPGNGADIPGYTQLVSVPTVPADTTPTTTDPGGGPGKLPGETVTSDKPTAGASSSGGSGGSGSVPPIGWLLVVALVVVLLAPAAVRVAVRRSRLARAIDGGPSCEYAWLELRDRVVDLRLPWSGSLTPRARTRFVEPLLSGDPDGVAALDRLSLTVERARYAGSPVAGADPRSDVHDILAALTREVDWSQRAKAFLWPTSLLSGLRSRSGSGSGSGALASWPRRSASAQ